MSSRLLKGVLTLATGSIASSVVMALSVPLLTRVFTPSEFGVFGVYLTLTGLISMVASGKFESALMLTTYKSERSIIIKSCFLLLSLTSVMFFVVMLIFHELSLSYLGTDSLLTLLLLIPGVVVLSFHKFININTNSHREYTYSAKGALLRSLAVVSIQLGLGYLSFGVNGLILGSLASYIIFSLYMFNRTRFLEVYRYKKLSPKLSKFIFVKYERVYRYLFPQSVINYVSQQLPFLIFPIFYTSATIGGLFVAQRLLKMPAGVLTMSIRNVFFPYFRDKNELKLDLFFPYLKLTLGLFLFGLPLVSVIFYYISDVILLLLGEGWKDAGDYSKYILLWVFMSVINVATTPALTIIGDNRFLLYYEIFDIIIKAIVLIYTVNVFELPIHTIAIYSIVASISYVLLIALCAYRLFLHRLELTRGGE